MGCYVWQATAALLWSNNWHLYVPPPHPHYSSWAGAQLGKLLGAPPLDCATPCALPVQATRLPTPCCPPTSRHLVTAWTSPRWLRRRLSLLRRRPFCPPTSQSLERTMEVRMLWVCCGYGYGCFGYGCCGCRVQGSRCTRLAAPAGPWHRNAHVVGIVPALPFRCAHGWGAQLACPLINAAQSCSG